MAFLTLQEAINKTQIRLSQVSGSAVQLYSEDRIAEYIQSIFDFVFDEMVLPDYKQWFTDLTLDQSTGTITDDISAIKEYRDVIYVYRKGYNKPLPRVPETNFIAPELQGIEARYIDSSTTENKVIRIWPSTATSTIHILAKVRPDNFTLTDTIKVDGELIVSGATWFYSEDDGTNPGAIQKSQTMFEQRRKQIEDGNTDQPIELDPRIDDIHDSWETI